MKVENCTIDDFHEIRAAITSFWGSDRTLYLHHPTLVYEFGNTAFVIRDQGRVAAYLFGFFAQVESVAYVHLVGVTEHYRRQGLAQKLYGHFVGVAREHRIEKLKAITTADNLRSIQFHTLKMGMQLKGEPNAAGIPVVKHYSGPGQDRVVFEKRISDRTRPDVLIPEAL